MNRSRHFDENHRSIDACHVGGILLHASRAATKTVCSSWMDTSPSKATPKAAAAVNSWAKDDLQSVNNRNNQKSMPQGSKEMETSDSCIHVCVHLQVKIPTHIPIHRNTIYSIYIHTDTNHMRMDAYNTNVCICIYIYMHTWCAASVRFKGCQVNTFLC